MIKDLEHDGDWAALLQRSRSRPVFLLKHSTRCSISAAALREYRHFEATEPGAELWRVLVIEKRLLSAKVASESGLRHESPQVLLLSGGQVVWHASHWSITEEAMADALRKATAVQ